MRKKFPILNLFVLSIALFSCNKLTPAGFWKSFKKDLIVKNYSDQGPWGGCRELHWKTNKKNSFTFKIISEFASKNGWQLSDSIKFQKDSIDKFITVFYNGDKNFTDSIVETIDSLPALINSNRTLYRFKTGWELFKAGNNTCTEVNGFVEITENGKEMSVSHKWGE